MLVCTSRSWRGATGSADLFRRPPPVEAGERVRDRAPPTLPDVPRGGNLMGDLGAVAQSWHRAAERNAHPGGAEVPTRKPWSRPPASLPGMEVHHQRCAVRSITPAQFPCVALQKDGSSRLIVGRPTPDTFQRRGQAA
jgi:hypothetical protein